MYIPSFHLVSRAAAACTGTTYTIAAGDTCSTIATKNGVTISDLVVQNQDICGGANQNLLQVGTAVCIVPGAGVNAGPTIVADALNTAAYTALQPCTGHVDIVLGGATCTTIAAKYNVTLAALMAVAIPGQCAKLEAADAICVPGTATTSLTVGGAALPAGQAVIPAVIPPVASATPPS
ncbi:hypothetical protein BCR33DRAFT_109437 [Rhizoclosmatium globosum]|uniref:LysM domain-containing protein n=1 Tax=Rhizoclosmatium globosum TaxID=329046 RepID=A0A1Y2CI88_9FUNG|nr:hypothetical protein BCR33DRAFT_109437 [Rhizoclosmatium globosum]|eukprot:ORY46768.1 hypothetical protein BCR33DRAFT_109437 [Rhizoclosmatium globosum]